MITRNQIVRCEENVMSHCAQKVITAFGYMLYNPLNMNSHECNTAVIKDFSDLDGCIPAVESFYASNLVSPRISAGGCAGEREILLPYLRSNGWTVDIYGDRKPMYYAGGCDLSPKTSLTVRLLTEMDDTLFRMHVENDCGGDWCAIAAKDCMEYGSLDEYVGYENGVGASSAGFEHDPVTSLTLVQDVFTLPAFRSKGYAGDVMRYALKDQTERYPYGIYLWVENPIAVRLYEKLGFRYLDIDYPQWEAFKRLRPFDDR